MADIENDATTEPKITSINDPDNDPTKDSNKQEENNNGEIIDNNKEQEKKEQKEEKEIDKKNDNNINQEEKKDNENEINKDNNKKKEESEIEEIPEGNNNQKDSDKVNKEVDNEHNDDNIDNVQKEEDRGNEEKNKDKSEPQNEEDNNINDQKEKNEIKDESSDNLESAVVIKDIGELDDNNETEEKKNDENEDEDKKKDEDEDGDDNKSKKNDEEEEEKKEEDKLPEKHERSEFSLEGAIQPISIYTRRVMDISKINDYLNPNSSRGQVGGRNLGNTCFMNSSIACLSNTTELTYYFLKGDYLKDINEENNLGMKGELAKEWGKLLKEYWVENTRVGDPSDFKYTIGRRVERFRGYGQQDSNEFMSVFLDYLNEDLNKVSKKEYIEMKEKGENETDEECAKRFWECNLKRNDSIVTDLFCGQFKSTITCPDCGWINITFDPFDTINLPLLSQKKRNDRDYGKMDEFKFFYIPKNVFRQPMCLEIKGIENSVLICGLIDRIKKEKKFIYHDKINDLLIVDMLRKDKYGYADKTQSVKYFSYDREFIFSFDFDRKKDEFAFPVYMYKSSDRDTKSEYPRMVFCKKDDNLDVIKKKIYFYLRKYILSPLKKDNEEKDEISLEIEKYLKDENNELLDEKIYDMVEKEYNEVFKVYNNDNEEKKNEDKNEDDKKDEDKNEDDKDEKDKNKEDNNEEKIDNEEQQNEEGKIDNEEEKKEEDNKEGEEKKADEENNDEKKEKGEEEGDEKKEEENKEGEEAKVDEENKNEEKKPGEEKKEEEKKEEENKEGEDKKNEGIKNNEDNNKENNKENEADKNKPQEAEEISEEAQIKKSIENFKKDIPFNIFIRREKDDGYYHGKYIFLSAKYFSSYSKKLKEFLQIEDPSAPLTDIKIDMNDYEIVVEFNEDSKYINKDNFDLDHFEKISFEYEEKKEEPKKEEEEEDDGKMTLEKCLKKFCKEEQLEPGDEWYCSKCKKHVLAKKKLDLYYLPKILIICFKRFIKDSYRWEKNEDEVDFPIENMDMKNFVIGPDKEHSKYDLFAVSQHYGSTGFGHYTAVCKNDGKWYSYNDSSCSETNESDVLSSAAYVLFYRRQTD